MMSLRRQIEIRNANSFQVKSLYRKHFLEIHVSLLSSRHVGALQVSQARLPDPQPHFFYIEQLSTGFCLDWIQLV